MKRVRPRAFTLVELLVAVGVSGLIVGMLLTLVVNLLTGYQRASGALAIEARAGPVLEQLRVDLESMVQRPSDEGLLAASVREDPAGFGWGRSAKPGGGRSRRLDAGEPIGTNRFGKGGVWLRLLTAAPALGEEVVAGVRAVGYRIELRRVTGAPDAPLQYQLYRSEVGTAETYARGYDLDPAEGDYADRNTLTVPEEEDLLAAEVVDFGVRLYRRDSPGAGRTRLFPGMGGSGGFLATGQPGVGDPFPTQVEVMLRFLTPEGSRQLEALRAGRIEAGWWEIVDRHSHTVSRLVSIPARFY